MGNQSSCLQQWCVHSWGLAFGHNDQSQCGRRWLFYCLGVANVSVQNKKDGVSAFGDASTSLCQAMEIFVHCLEPQISEQGIFDQLPVLGDGFFGDRVYYTIAVFWQGLYIDHG